MPELRIDPLSGLRVIVAGERGERPGAWLVGGASGPPSTPRATRSPRATRTETPPEVYALRDDGGAPDGPGWRVRVVPNLYPALSGNDEQAPDPLGVRARRGRPVRRRGRRRAPTRW